MGSVKKATATKASWRRPSCYHDARGLDELELRPEVVTEGHPPPADEHRVDREVDLVEEVVLQQRLAERTVAVAHDVLSM